MNYHIIFANTFGDAAIIHRENPFSLLKVLLPCADRASLLQSAEREEWGKAASHPNVTVTAIAESLADYFRGRPLRIPWEWMDMRSLTELQQSVLRAVADIPYGSVSAYKDVAAAIGCPRASRFVGTTVAKNPFPILIPCHRVVRSDGSIGQFGGGTEMKRRLIELEAENAPA
ncbi:MAG: cysteine methyltransferase [Deltaproteobacteria bacterium]|nr:MAG: cysteine methyltransferase [Deltaproteobacteria bacterium]